MSGRSNIAYLLLYRAASGSNPGIPKKWGNVSEIFLLMPQLWHQKLSISTRLSPTSLLIRIVDRGFSRFSIGRIRSWSSLGIWNLDFFRETRRPFFSFFSLVEIDLVRSDFFTFLNRINLFWAQNKINDTDEKNCWAHFVVFCPKHYTFICMEAARIF